MRTRLPIKLKLAVGSAALTFGILCLFAVVIGAVAEQRIVAGFDDDLRATAADLEQLLTIELGPDGRLVIEAGGRALAGGLRHRRCQRAGAEPPRRVGMARPTRPTWARRSPG